MNRFDKAVVPVPNKSGFDLSHPWLGTPTVGTLVPCFVKEMIPNDTLDVKVTGKIELPPMATTFYGRVQCKIEAFFVPYRILYGGWKTLVERALDPADSLEGSTVNKFFPGLVYPFLADQSTFTYEKKWFGPNGLLDYLGYKVNLADTITGGAVMAGNSIRLKNPFRLLAYHKIFEDHYVDRRTSRPLFSPPVSNAGLQVYPSYAQLPFVSAYAANNSTSQNFWSVRNASTGDNLLFGDGSFVFDFHQRLYDKDYFTNSTSKPQYGGEQSVGIVSSAFTISSLRVANSLQMFSEKYNIAGDRYPDLHKILYGIYPADAITDRALYLGRTSFDIYNKAIYQSNDGTDAATDSLNAFNSVGSKYGVPMGLGDGRLAKFTASEHGVFMALMSIVPESIYGTGCSRAWYYNKFIDLPNAQLSNIGDQEVYKGELSDTFVYNNASSSYLPSDDTFSYTQRFAEHKTMPGEVHGLLRDGQNLEHYALQRSYSGTSLAFGQDFQTIKISALDQLTAVDGTLADYGSWASLWFDAKLISTLPAYSIPSLVDMENYSHKEIVSNGSKHL